MQIRVWQALLRGLVQHEDYRKSARYVDVSADVISDIEGLSNSTSSIEQFECLHRLLIPIHFKCHLHCQILYK